VYRPTHDNQYDHVPKQKIKIKNPNKQLKQQQHRTHRAAKS